MKSANFSYSAITTSGTSNRTLRGKVTLKDDGTITVNLTDTRMCSANMRYMAKRHGEKIAKEGFIDPSITNIVEQNTNSDLVSILTKETQSLKIQYIEKTKQYAEKKFNWANTLWLSSITDRYDRFGIKWEMKRTPNYGSNGPSHIEKPTPLTDQNEEHKIMWDALDEAKKIYMMGLSVYVQKQITIAERHYENSILKLAHRIETKGLDISKLSTVTSHVGVNIETILTDGKITVKAWTIIAEGPIQQPHYRYLVK